MRVARSLWHLTAAVAGRVARHSQMARASQFAYVSFVASIPFAFVLISVIGLVASPQSYSTLVDNTRGTVPDQLADFLDGLLQAASSSAGQSILFLVLGLITGVWLAGNVAGSLMDGLDDAFERPHRPWLKGKARALSLAIATALVVVLTTILAVFGPGVLQWVVERVGAPRSTQVMIQVVVSLTGALIFWGYLVLLYHFAPNGQRIPMRSALLGALVGVIGWFIVANLFRLYVDNIGSYNRVYGSLGAVVIFLVFLYLTALTVLIGGETAAQIDEDDAGSGVTTAVQA